MTFGEKLYQLRRQEGISQEDLADRLNVSRQAVSRWEQGAVLPDAPNLLNISKLFGVTTDYLLHDEFDSDRDIPVVKHTENEAQKERNRQTALFWMLVLQAMACIVELITWFVVDFFIMVLYGVVVHAVSIFAFERSYRKHRDGERADHYRRIFYRTAVWMVAYTPIRAAVGGLWSLCLWQFAPADFYPAVLVEGSILLIYLIVCLSVTLKLKKKA